MENVRDEQYYQKNIDQDELDLTQPDGNIYGNNGIKTDKQGNKQVYEPLVLKKRNSGTVVFRQFFPIVVGLGFQYV
jgi:hypothetical protein